MRVLCIYRAVARRFFAMQVQSLFWQSTNVLRSVDQMYGRVLWNKHASSPYMHVTRTKTLFFMLCFECFVFWSESKENDMRMFKDNSLSLLKCASGFNNWLVNHSSESGAYFYDSERISLKIKKGHERCVSTVSDAQKLPDLPETVLRHSKIEAQSSLIKSTSLE